MKLKNQCGIRLSDEEFLKMKAIAKNEDRTISYVARKLVIQSLEQNKTATDKK